MKRLTEVTATLSLLGPALAGCGGHEESCDTRPEVRNIADHIGQANRPSFQTEVMVSDNPDVRVTVIGPENRVRIHNPIALRCGRKIVEFLGVWPNGQIELMDAENAEWVMIYHPNHPLEMVEADEAIEDPSAHGLIIESRRMHEVPYIDNLQGGFHDGQITYGLRR